jgi:hypothetical protein
MKLYNKRDDFNFPICELSHYPISLRSKEKELIRMFEMVLGRGKWTCLKQKGKVQVENIQNLTPHA